MKLYKGIVLMVFSALCVVVGQFLWKLSASHLYFAFLGLAIYALGALFMISAFRYGELSVLHPVISISYVIGIFVGCSFFQEAVTLTKLAGIAAIIIGLVFLGLSSKKHK